MHPGGRNPGGGLPNLPGMEQVLRQPGSDERTSSHWRPPTNKQDEWAHRFPANAATHYPDNRQHYQPPQMSHEVIEARQKLAEMGNASRQEAAQILSSCVPPICPHCSSSCCLADGLRGCSRLAVVWLFEYITVRTFHLQLYGRLLQHPEPDCLISNDCSRWQRRAEATRGGGLGPADDAVHTHTIASFCSGLANTLLLPVFDCFDCFDCFAAVEIVHGREGAMF